jgi:hypothetical protein
MSGAWGLPIRSTFFSGPSSKLVGSGKLSGLLKTSEYHSYGSGSAVAEAVSHDVIPSSPKFDFEKGKLRWGGQWVHWAGPGRYTDLIPLGPISYSYLAIWDSKYPESLRAELIRFLRTLELWETTPGKKEISAHEVWASSLMKGPAYADELSDVFAYKMRETNPDSYNFVFPARFLIRWEQGVDDLILSTEATYSDPSALEEFEITLCSILERVAENEIVLPSDEQILSERSTTTSFIAREERCLPHWEAALSCREFNTTELLGKRCVVPVYPGGIRDTVIADISANNSIRWIERSVRHILTYVPESAVTLFSSSMKSRLDDVVNRKGSHILRDMKKCGLTYNTKDLFPIVKRCLMKYFRDDRWERLNIFNNSRYLDDNIWRETSRGYFLGMANHVVTLCNIVIHYIARETVPKYLRPFKMAAILGNDDSDVVVYENSTRRHKKIALEYLEVEHDVHARLGNLTNFKKSVVTDFGLFYEHYGKAGWEDKEALVCNALACAYLAPSIRVAKLYIVGQSDRFNSSWARQSLRDLVEYWGAEFFTPQVEYKINFEAGGWLNRTASGLKTTLVDIDRLSRKYSTQLISYAVAVAALNVKPPRPEFKTKGLVVNHVYSGEAKKAPPELQLYTIVDEDLRLFYRKLTTYQRNFSRRMDTFSKLSRYVRVTDDLDVIRKRLLKTRPWYQIPDSMVQGHKDWLSTMTLTHLSEVFGENESDLEVKIRLINNEIDPANTYLEELRWDPPIPDSVKKISLSADAWQIYPASQFSNSGFLPLLEYYSREFRYPITRILGRARLPSMVGEQERKHFALSRFRARREVKNQREILTIDDPEDVIYPVIDLDEVMERARKEREEDPSIAREFQELLKTVETRSQEEIELSNRRIDVMMAAMSDRRDMHVVLREAGLLEEEPSVDVFDNDDEDLGLDFGF